MALWVYDFLALRAGSTTNLTEWPWNLPTRLKIGTNRSRLRPAGETPNLENQQKLRDLASTLCMSVRRAAPANQKRCPGIPRISVIRKATYSQAGPPNDGHPGDTRASFLVGGPCPPNERNPGEARASLLVGGCGPPTNIDARSQSPEASGRPWHLWPQVRLVGGEGKGGRSHSPRASGRP